ncbi:hypothetical protein AcW1_001667 [Taiwanofungus camphoratus]|nr:hypothetical protein AcW1_001667 [Antrodia cinnamomea]
MRHHASLMGQPYGFVHMRMLETYTMRLGDGAPFSNFEPHQLEPYWPSRQDEILRSHTDGFICVDHYVSQLYNSHQIRTRAEKENK